ncbi:MAG TPA: 7-cyano-7-deazaguanine synthase [Myxococcota bacterium]|nr:7-cyano-7-deazaguanine synthase [Myxococcota bacterium]
MNEYRYLIDRQRRVSGGPSAESARLLVSLHGPDAHTWLGALDVAERDLFRVGSAILGCDRLSSRNRDGQRWQRTIHLDLTLEEPARWRPHTELLAELLCFLTDDAWHLEFQHGSLPPQQPRLPLADFEPTGVALFSGGLDSAVGLLARSRSSTDQARQLLAVCIHGSTQQRAHREKTFNHVVARGANAHFLPFHNALRKRDKTLVYEGTQRSRCFFFLAAGAVAASQKRVPTVEVYEPGVGAINLPLCSGQVGAEATRALHPRTLVLFNRLLAAVLDRPVRVIAPFLLHTKAELCRLAGQDLATIAGHAISCDEGERNKHDPSVHCGLCSSCLFRRIALHAVGHDPTKYRDQLSSRRSLYELGLFGLQARRLEQLRRFEDLIDLDLDLDLDLDELRALVSDGPSPALRLEEELVTLFHRYARETHAYLTEAPPQPRPRASQAQEEGRP